MDTIAVEAAIHPIYKCKYHGCTVQTGSNGAQGIQGVVELIGNSSIVPFASENEKPIF
ncbi:hypothetical protein [Clostridium ljungdahlii]|uniref:hypothetical protein n=1 Tax=Clostridium ljungdahlii TaxID=1538 RepID=UPI000B2E4F0D|nr:hypothetical protein [Clostridium ljungdahlii]